MIPTLETPRLILRPLSLEDVPAIQKHFPQWEVVKYMPLTVPWPYPEDGALSFVRDHAIPGMEKGTHWHWAIRRKVAPDQSIGVVSLFDRDPADNKAEHQGFWLAPEFQRQGFAGEAVEAATHFWFKTLGKPVLRAGNAAINTGSSHIQSKRGMRKVDECEFAHIGGLLLSELWEITREEWLALHPSTEQKKRGPLMGSGPL